MCVRPSGLTSGLLAYDGGLRCESVESQHLVSEVLARMYTKAGGQGWYGIVVAGLGDWETMAKWGWWDAACDVFVMRTGLFKGGKNVVCVRPSGLTSGLLA